MKIKKALLVEDYANLQYGISEQIKSIFGEETLVLIAGNLDELERQYSRNAPELDVIFMDTSLVGSTNTFEFVKRISKHFTGPIVATSSNEFHRKKMMELGCTHECDKSELGPFLERWRDFERVKS